VFLFSKLVVFRVLLLFRISFCLLGELVDKNEYLLLGLMISFAGNILALPCAVMRLFFKSLRTAADDEKDVLVSCLLSSFTEDD